MGRIWTRRERLSQPGAAGKALWYLERSRDLFPPTDPALVFVFSHLRRIYDVKGEWAKGIAFLEQQRRIFQQSGNTYGAVYLLSLLKEVYAAIGDWRKAYNAVAQGLQLLDQMPETPFLRVRLIGYHTWHMLWSGRYHECEHEIRKTAWLGELHEVKAKQIDGETEAAELAIAETYYRQCLNYRWLGRRYFECRALTGLTRVKHAQGDYTAIPPLLAEAEALAQQYEYNDHLASLRLTHGHMAWEEALSTDVGSGLNGFDGALDRYRQALIYALGYNRFLLDEVLWSGGVCTPLRPIIPHCLERGEEGQRMLAALRDWWKTGVNDIGTPRPDTISPLPEGVPLLEAERIAREREPGDGSRQKTVLERIEEPLLSK